ncbi:MAG: S8 family serine peptidase [Actinomycetes bacterium]
MRHGAVKGVSAALVALSVVAASFWASSAAADPLDQPTAAATPSASPTESPAPESASSDLQRYIVTVDPGTQADVANAVTEAGGIVTATYDKALDGLAVEMTPADATALRADDSVVSVEVDQPVAISSGAVISDAGCATYSLPRGDDIGTSAVSLGFNVNWFGTSYNQILINNNGGISFNDGGGSFTSYTGIDLRTTSRPLILPVFTDLDTRNAASSVVTYGPITSFDGTNGYCVNWVNVGHYSQSVPYYSAQLLLLNRGGGNIDVIFNYDNIDALTATTGLEIGYADPAGSANDMRFAYSGVSNPNPYVNGGSAALISNRVIPAGSTIPAVNGRYAYEIRPGASPTATPTASASASPTATSPAPCSTSTPSGTQGCATWGLDRIDQRSLPLDTTFTPAGTGSGVRAYVIDTGVYASNDFSTRLTTGYDFVDNDAVATDCHGHGTHVAGTIAGTTYGVAKSATLVPVRVLDCFGSGYTSDVIAGINWVISDHQSNPNSPAVANMSLGGGANKSMDDAVAAAVAAGITMVVAAGNSNVDACTVSPARELTAVTVGATDSTDTRAAFSNYGSCVDIFAPGVSITSDGIANPSSTATMSGTSVAAPHVAGAAAVYLGLNPNATPAQVTTSLTSSSSSVVLSAGSGSPNYLLYARSFAAYTPSPSASSSSAPPSNQNSGASGGSSGGGGGGGSDADIREVRPAFGPTTGGSTINILGFGFWGASAVTIGGKSASFTVINAANIEAVTPPGLAGWQDVIVTLAVGRAVALGGYRYENPPTPPPGQVVIQESASASTTALPASSVNTIPVVRSSVSAVRLAANGTMSLSMRVPGAAKGQQVSLYKAGKRIRSGKVTKAGAVAFTGVPPASGTYSVVLSRGGKVVSRTQPVLVAAPRR